MRTHIEFRSGAFPPNPGEEQQVNPGRWGRRLAEFLASELPRHGFSVGEVFAEDWGWVVPLENAQFPLWIGCGNYEEYPEDGFLVFIEPSKPFVRRLFRKVDARPVVERLATALEATLRSHSGVRDLSWWSSSVAHRLTGRGTGDGPPGSAGDFRGAS